MSIPDDRDFGDPAASHRHPEPLVLGEPPAAPTLTVVLLSCNQKAYLGQALDSVLAQRTDFPFDVQVSDDASDDGSRALIERYIAEHPGVVHAVVHARNLGPFDNYVDAHNRARGDYVAHLDGDDLCLPGKLQAQVDHLEASPGTAACWHAVRLIDDEGRSLGTIDTRRSVFRDGRVRLEDALELGSVAVHSSLVYRRRVRVTRTPAVDPIDWFYTIEYLRHGEGHVLGETLGAYRRTSDSMSRQPNVSTSVRRRYAAMISHYVDRLPEHRRRLMTLSLLLVVSDVYARRPRFRFFLGPLWRARGRPAGPRDLARALARFRALNRAFSGDSSRR